MKENKSIWIYVLFFGAIWGILEATLGYVLQFLPPLVSGSVMFPIAATLMLITYQNTKSRSAMVYVAAIAASIKAINLFMYVKSRFIYNSNCHNIIYCFVVFF